jgi:predicted DNA-binding transcriptional regulator YafY
MIMITKKFLPLLLLAELRKHTDVGHPLTQEALRQLIARDYAINVDRKTIGRTLVDLADFLNEVVFDCTLGYRENERTNGETIKTDWYIERELTDSELQLVIQSLRLFHTLDIKTQDQLIEKLRGLTSQHFNSPEKIEHLPNDERLNLQLFLTIELISEAIRDGKQISFQYRDYKADKKMHPRLDTTGQPKIYKVSPHRIFANDGFYYLMLSNGLYSEILYFRLEKIAEIEILSDKARALTTIPGYERGFSYRQHSREHIYAFSGQSSQVTFLTTENYIGYIIDWFSKDFKVEQAAQGKLRITLTVNEDAMEHWAIRYGAGVEILTPQRLREAVKAHLKKIYEQYND